MKIDVLKSCSSYASKARRVNTCDNFQQHSFYNLFPYEVCTCKSKLGIKALHMNSKICIQISKNYKNSAANSENLELCFEKRCYSTQWTLKTLWLYRQLISPPRTFSVIPKCTPHLNETNAFIIFRSNFPHKINVGYEVKKSPELFSKLWLVLLS